MSCHSSGRFAFLDGRVFVAAGALTGRRHHAGVHDLTAPWNVARRLDLPHQHGKKFVDQLQRLQPLPNQPDGLGIRHPSFRGQAEEPAEGVAITDLVFGLVVGQAVQVLKDQHLEHRHHVKRLAAGIALALFLMHLLQQRTKAFPVNGVGQLGQGVAQLFQLLVAVVKVEESRLHRRGSWSWLVGPMIARVGLNY